MPALAAMARDLIASDYAALSQMRAPIANRGTGAPPISLRATSRRHCFDTAPKHRNE
jgi:hypothetical protein